MAQDKRQAQTPAAANVELLDDNDLGRGVAKRDRRPSAYDGVVGQLAEAFKAGSVRTGRIVSTDEEAQVKDLNELRRAGNFHGVLLKTRKQGTNALEVRFQIKGLK